MRKQVSNQEWAGLLKTNTDGSSVCRRWLNNSMGDDMRITFDRATNEGTNLRSGGRAYVDDLFVFIDHWGECPNR